jgi:hypothetical protein
MPWREASPLVFHVMDLAGNRRRPEDARAVFARLLQAGACLVPACERGGAERSPGIREIDEAAGDDRYVFLTVGRPLDAGAVHDTVVAVAFTLEALLTGRPKGPVEKLKITHRHFLGWRPHDLLGAYEKTVEDLGDADDQYGSRSAEAIYDLAERWTIFDVGKIRKLLQLEQQVLRHPDEADRLRARAVRLLPGVQVPGDGKKIRSVHFLDLARRRWEYDEKRGMKWPATLESYPASEAVYEGRLPLRAAIAWRDPVTGIWQPGPHDLAASCPEDCRW